MHLTVESASAAVYRDGHGKHTLSTELNQTRPATCAADVVRLHACASDKTRAVLRGCRGRARSTSPRTSAQYHKRQFLWRHMHAARDMVKELFILVGLDINNLTMLLGSCLAASNHQPVCSIVQRHSENTIRRLEQSRMLSRQPCICAIGSDAFANSGMPRLGFRI